MIDFIRWVGVGNEVHWPCVGLLLVAAAALIYAWSHRSNGNGK